MDVFYAIAEPTRRMIVEMLAKKGRLSATDISNQFDSSAPAISQHLKVLREARLVKVKKEGQKRFYELDQDGIRELELWTEKMSILWNKRLDRLDTLLNNKK